MTSDDGFGIRSSMFLMTPTESESTELEAFAPRKLTDSPWYTPSRTLLISSGVLRIVTKVLKQYLKNVNRLPEKLYKNN